MGSLSSSVEGAVTSLSHHAGRPVPGAALFSNWDFVSFDSLYPPHSPQNPTSGTTDLSSASLSLGVWGPVLCRFHGEARPCGPVFL